jgi:hypothetical protein
MAKYAESDPQDYAVWQAIHSEWARLVNAEMEHRADRTPGWYRELLGTVDAREQHSLGSPGSSMSNLSPTEAFLRGCQGGY